MHIYNNPVTTMQSLCHNNSCWVLFPRKWGGYIKYLFIKSGYSGMPSAYIIARVYKRREIDCSLDLSPNNIIINSYVAKTVIITEQKM